jgi:protein TonB
MTALALHLPQRPGVSRWGFAALAILLAHAGLVASIALWYARTPVEPNIVPAVTISLVPVEATAPEIHNEDIAVGPAMQQAEETREKPPEEDKVEKLDQPPLPPQEAYVALPRIQEKQIEEPKPVVQPPAPETRAPPKTERVAQFTEASANAYNALVFGHMQRFKRYPSSARGASGVVVVRFELNRTGALIGSAVTKSSGNAALDQAALDLLRRASPFPPFPVAKPGERDSYVAPVNFAH